MELSQKPLSFKDACNFYKDNVVCGIYKITNIINKHCYIGQSVNIRKRWIAHKNSSLDYPLYNAFKKYGINNFTFEIIEECNRDELNEKEKYYIEKFNSYKNGYNQTLECIGGGHLRAFTIEELYNLFDDLKNTNISKFELAKKYNCSERTIRDINNGRCWYDDNVDYPIRKKNITNNIYRCSLCGKEIKTKGATMCTKCFRLYSRKIQDRPDKIKLAELIVNNGFIKTGKLFGVSGNTIKKWCKQYKIPYKIKEIRQWYFNKINQKDPLLIKLNNNKKDKKTNERKVYQIDMFTGDVVKQYNKISDACKILNIKKGSHITEACQKKLKNAYGFDWCYVEDYFKYLIEKDFLGVKEYDRITVTTTCR